MAEIYNINMGLIDIGNMPKHAFKALVKKKETEHTLSELNNEKVKHSKVAHMEHKVLEMQEYLKPNGMSIEQVQFTFLIRSRMLDIKGNYKTQHTDMLCPVCGKHEDSQAHLMVFEELNERNTVVAQTPEYSSLFGPSLGKLVQISSIIRENYSKRKDKLKSD